MYSVGDGQPSCVEANFSSSQLNTHIDHTYDTAFRYDQLFYEHSNRSCDRLNNDIDHIHEIWLDGIFSYVVPNDPFEL